MTRLKLTAIFFLLLISLGAHAQTMAVESFELAQTDLTANTPGTMVHDQNGEVCALIKLETTQKGFTFNVGVLGVAKTEEHVGEIWIYVPFGIKKITVQHPQLGTLRDYPIPCSIDKGRTYIMKLTAGNVRTIVEHAPTKQFLYIKLNPSDAGVEVNGVRKNTKNGVYSELLPYGRYQYRAFCPNYHDENGEVDVSGQKQTIEVNLKPAFGYLSVSDNDRKEYAGASVYVDDKLVGAIPVSQLQLGSGSHGITVMKEFYKPYSSIFVIADEQTKVIIPQLAPDFADITLSTSAGASIYVNDEFKGKGTWSGRLATGSYLFETRQDGHIPYKMSYDITDRDNGKSISIQSPMPVYGSLIIESTPDDAKAYIDENYVGETPLFIQQQIIGQHSVTLKLDGYKPQTKTVTVAEGAEASLSFTLEKGSVGISLAGNGSASGQPANCYIVSESGTYSFPTVKGNSTVSVGPVASAAVLWESFGTSVTPSVGDLIKTVSYEDGTITFRTADTFKEGNAVIAAKDVSGMIRWSWHIWLTDQPQAQVYNNNAGTMMDRNLGATSAKPGDAGALGLLYQWGRKDPFLGSSSINSRTVAKSTITWPSPVSTNSSRGTESYVTANPTTFVYASSSPYDWHYSSRDNTLWTTSGKSKSIYDPCPPGWRVPDGGSNGVWAKAGFDNTTYDSKNEGMSFRISSPSNAWYPASGYRHGMDGVLYGVGFHGYYRSASPGGNGSDRAYSLLFSDDGTFNPSYNGFRSSGYSVRCVRESK